MVRRRGNMFADSDAKVIIFTGNATVTKAGCLVMGRGAAADAKAIFDNCDQAFGQLVKHHAKINGSTAPYGILIHPDRGKPVLAVFQVKRHFRDKADLELIAFSVGMLTALAKTDWKHLTIAMNYPGIGWGGRTKKEVAPLLRSLPDNVEVWEFPQS